ncbi:MAG: hypothetical protein HZA48_03940 [Planctomycetes bacterium]|nr:hypothetical protein [Planctomycetota bacterium]
MARCLFFALLSAAVVCTGAYMFGTCPAQDSPRVSDLPALDKDGRNFAFADDSDFEKMKTPKPGDWLDAYDEPGQSFSQYSNSNPNKPDKKHTTIYLQPIGLFTDEEKELLSKLEEFTKIFFQMPVVLKTAVALPDAEEYKRTRTSGNKKWVQYRTDFFLEKVLQPALPDDAFCYLGITMKDLYPDDEWNYVFGQASLKERVGVYSLARYFPEFWGQKDTDESRILSLRRSCETLVHETGHMFNMLHCIYYECVMAGSNSMDEADRRPLHECPVCLRKLQWNTGFDANKRYEQLEKFCRDNKLDKEADWMKKRMEKIKSAVK